MALEGWLLDKSAATRTHGPALAQSVAEAGGELFLCEVGLLEQLYSTVSSTDYDRTAQALRNWFPVLEAPADILLRALQLQRDLAHHHGKWHRLSIPDLLVAETALYHGVGVLHIDGDFEKIAKVRPLRQRRL